MFNFSLTESKQQVQNKFKATNSRQSLHQIVLERELSLYSNGRHYLLYTAAITGLFLYLKTVSVSLTYEVFIYSHCHNYSLLNSQQLTQLFSGYQVIEWIPLTEETITTTSYIDLLYSKCSNEVLSFPSTLYCGSDIKFLGPTQQSIGFPSTSFTASMIHF